MSALSCCRIRTVRMIIVSNLRTFRKGPLEPLICETWVRVPFGDGTIDNSSADFNPRQSQTNSAPLQASFQSSARKHPQCEPQAKMICTLCTRTYINVRNQNKIKKSGVGHQLFRISVYKHTIKIYYLGQIFSSQILPIKTRLMSLLKNNIFCWKLIWTTQAPPPSKKSYDFLLKPRLYTTKVVQTQTEILWN